MSQQESSKRPEAETVDAQPKLVGAIAASLALIIGIGLLGGSMMVGRADIESERVLRGTDEFFERGTSAVSDIDRSWAQINSSLMSESPGYAWIDRRAGIVRVPIDRAIDLICIEQGRPFETRVERQESP
jgi:hypothetical protein